MSRKANPTVVGGFVAGAVALVVAAVLVFGGGLFFQERYRFVLFFDGSVKGLAAGAPVVCRGVRIGTVTDLLVRIDPKDLSVHIPVFIEVDADRLVEREEQEKGLRKSLALLVERGLRGQLQIQSLVTGQLMVDLDFHPGKSGMVSGIPMGVPEIPTIPTTFQELARTVEDLPLQEIARRTGNTLAGIEKLVNAPEILQSLRSAREALEEFRRLAVETRQGVGAALAKVNGAVDGVQKVVAEIDARVVSLSGDARGALDDARSLVRRLDESVGPVADRVEAAAQGVQVLAQRVDRRVDPLADRFGETLGEVGALVRRVDGRVDPAFTSVEGAARDVGKLARDADADLQPVLQTLRKAGDRAAEALAQATRTLEALGGASSSDSPLGRELSNALREISGTARSLRVLADYLDQHPDALLRGKTDPGGLR